MDKKEILRLFREDAGGDPQDLINILDTHLNCGSTRSFDGTLVLYHLGETVLSVSSDGVDFFQSTT